jgi:hypothetical protein
VTTSSTIATIGATFRSVSIAVQVNRSTSSFSGAATDFYIINKIRIGHALILMLKILRRMFVQNYNTLSFKWA